MVKRYLILPLFIVFLDQLTKYLVSNFLNNSIIIIPGILMIIKVTNTGAAFGLFSGYNMLFGWLNLIVIGILLFYFNTLNDLGKLASAIIIAGAVGNLIDRILLGFVVDFIDFRFWPTFNVADISISVGAILLLFSQITAGEIRRKHWNKSWNSDS